jgi:hypothetical protein
MNAIEPVNNVIHGKAKTWWIKMLEMIAKVLDEH